jgi:hypothetical protein
MIVQSVRSGPYIQVGITYKACFQRCKFSRTKCRKLPENDIRDTEVQVTVSKELESLVRLRGIDCRAGECQRRRMRENLSTDILGGYPRKRRQMCGKRHIAGRYLVRQLRRLGSYLTDKVGDEGGLESATRKGRTELSERDGLYGTVDRGW